MYINKKDLYTLQVLTSSVCVIILIIILNTKQSDTSIVFEYFVLKFTEESI